MWTKLKEDFELYKKVQKKHYIEQVIGAQIAYVKENASFLYSKYCCPNRTDSQKLKDSKNKVILLGSFHDAYHLPILARAYMSKEQHVFVDSVDRSWDKRLYTYGLTWLTHYAHSPEATQRERIDYTSSYLVDCWYQWEKV